MHYKALRTFNGRHGFITEGDVVEMDDRYAAELAGRKPPWVEGAAGLQPSRRQAIPAAPEVKAPISHAAMKPPSADGVAREAAAAATARASRPAGPSPTGAIDNKPVAKR